MGETEQSFEALVLAGVAAVLGTGFVVGAMLALLSDGETTTLVLADSISVGTTVGVLLLLTAGALGTSQRWARFLGILSFGAVLVFGFPAVMELTVVPVAQTTIGGLATVSLLVRNPVRRTTRSEVDESESATKVGSTIR